MSLLQRTILISVLISAGITNASASEAQILTGNHLTWKSLPNQPKLQYAVLAGNPLEHDWFIVRIKLPAHYSDVVHAHTSTRYNTIISGSYHFKFSDTLDKTNSQKLLAGGFIECPANKKHFGYTNEETVIQISGMGPWEVLKSEGKSR